MSGVWAVLVAAGRGERLGGERPKAFAPLGGRPLLAESLGRLEASDLRRRDRRRGARRLGGARHPARRGDRCGKGGALRDGWLHAAPAPFASGSRRCRDEADVIVVHDAARPLVSDEVIERVLVPLGEGWDGAVPGLPGRRHRQACAERHGDRDGRAGRALHGPDAAGVPGRRRSGRLWPARPRRPRTARRTSKPPAAG